MMKLLRIFLVVLLFFGMNQAKAQCPYDNTFYVDLTPGGVGMTASDGCVWSGDLVTVNVVAGETYVFSLCSNFGLDDSYLTLYDNTGTVVLDFNDDFCGLYSEITWVATYTGVVNLLIDDFGCTSNTNCMQLDVTWLGAGPCTALPLDPICTSTGLSFAAGTTGTDATVTDPTNNWDCLSSAPDAEFFYLEIATAGDINMTLTGSSDVDFILWGPYSDLPTAESICGQWGTGGANGSVIDCSFSISATEYPDILGAQVGEVYVMVITNFSGLPQTLSLTQTGGTGATDCSIVCSADVGTFTITEDGVPASSPIYLCASGGGDCFSIVSNNDYVLPPAVAGEAAELMYAIYTCPPNTSVAPDLDPCYSGLLWTGQDISDCNNAGSIFLGAGLGPTVYLVPITMDDGDNNGNPNGAIHWDNDGDACFDMGAPVQITWLTQTAWSGSMDPCTGTASITVTGGLPEFDGSNYTITNTGPGTLGGTPITHGGTVTVSNLLNGETVTLDITDGEGCVVSVSYGPVTVTQPSVNNPGPLSGCDNVVLPPITGANLNTPAYYDGPGGTGTMYAAGASVTTSGTYYVYDNSGAPGFCWDEESFTITVTPTPVITNPGPLTGCDNVVLPAIAGANLTAGASYYDGPGGTGNSYAAGASITTSGTYYIYDNTGVPDNCSDEVSFTITINPSPAITNPGNLTGCDNVVLPAIAGTNLTAGVSYYDGAGGTGNSYAAGASITTSGTYYIYDNTGAPNNCSDEVSFTITVTPTPVITNPGSMSGCDNVVLPAIAGTNLTAGVSYYDGAGGTGNSYAAGASITTSGTYYIYDNTGAPNNCSDEVSFTITVTPSPVITNPGNLTGCDAVQLPAIVGTNLTAGVSYYDGVGGTGNSYAAGVSITTSGTYYVYDNTGAPDNCSDEVSFTITVTPTPVITNPGTLVGCDSVQLPAIAGTNLTAGVAYYDGSGGTGTAYAAGDWLYTSGTYYLYDNTGAPDNCSSEESFTVTVTSGPVIDLVADQTACASFNLLPITGTGLSGNQGYYDDSQLNGGQPITGPITTSQTVWMIDSVGNCTDETSYVITINPLPEVTGITGGGVYCDGDVVNDITVTVTGSPDWTVYYTLDGTAQNMTGSSSPINLGNAPGTYVLDSISDVNCSNTATGTETIVVNPIPAAPTAGTDSEYCSSATFDDMTASGGNGTFTWYSDQGLTDILGTGSTFSPFNETGTTVYYVTETENGCEGEYSEVIITVIDCEIIVPTAFTPNGDGNHDDWEIYNIDSVYPNAVVKIFNRWGNLLFESTPGAYDTNRWDGIYKGELLPVGSYYYIIEFNDDEKGSAKGTVSIVYNN